MRKEMCKYIYIDQGGLNVWNVRCLSDLNGSALLYRGGYRRAHRGDFICLRAPDFHLPPSPSPPPNPGKRIRAKLLEVPVIIITITLAQTILGSTWGAPWHRSAMPLANAWAVMCICRTHLIGSPRTMCLYRFISAASGNPTGQSGR